MVRVMCGVQLNDQKRLIVLMLMLDLNEIIDHLAMANCVMVWSCVEERGWSCLEKGIGV